MRYESSKLTPCKRVWGYTDCELLVQLFEFTAAYWKGWVGSEECASVEGDFALIGDVPTFLMCGAAQNAWRWSVTCTIEHFSRLSLPAKE